MKMRSYNLFSIVYVFALCLVIIALQLSYTDSPARAQIIILALALASVITTGLYQLYLLWARDHIIQKISSRRTEDVSSPCGFFIPLCQALTNFNTRMNLHISDLEKRLNCDRFQLQILNRRQRETEAVIYSIREAVIVTDSADRLMIANNAAEKLFNFRIDSNNQNNRTIDEIIRDADFVQLIKTARNQRPKCARSQFVRSTAEGKRTFDCLISSLQDDDQRFCGIVAVLHDVTHEKEMSRLKTDFVSHVSHELKTPLASIAAYAEMLVDGEARDSQTIQQFCSIIQTQSQRLNYLIEDILNVTRIESGIMKVTPRPFSISGLIKNTVDMMKCHAHDKNIKIKLQLPTNFDIIYADPEMINQVLINLLSNAVKYSNRDSTVWIEADINKETNCASVSVTDQGVGISPDQVEKIFEKFYRVESAKKHAEGTGLGLNLVKQIIEKFHNGRVFALSNPGHGSTFGFEIPLAENDKKQQNDESLQMIGENNE